MTRSFLNPTTNPFQYQLDELEVLQAFRQYEQLLREFYNDPTKAAVYKAAADRLELAIRQELLDPQTNLYRWYVGETTPNLNKWYAGVLNQSWSVITDLNNPQSPQTLQRRDQVYAAWDGSPNPSWKKDPNNGSLAWAAVQMGDIGPASEALANGLAWTMQNYFPAAGMTIADLAFQYQTMLPAANADIASTNVATPVVIDVLANDYSISTPSDQLLLELVNAPANGVANFVGGKIVYTPNTGFYGDDSFVYRVQAIDGGARTAKATIHVNRPPTANDQSLSLTQAAANILSSIEN